MARESEDYYYDDVADAQYVITISNIVFVLLENETTIYSFTLPLLACLFTKKFVFLSSFPSSSFSHASF